MVFGVILAGGIGSRMGNAEKPKQYIKIGDKPIIIHTIEKFYVHDAFEKLIVLCPKQWVEHTRNLVRQYMGDTDRVVDIGRRRDTQRNNHEFYSLYRGRLWFG